MSFNITNTVAAPALEGVDSLITMSWAASAANINNISVGQRAGVVSSGKIGYVSFVDPNGIYVKVKPAQPNTRFDSSTTPGILAASDVVTFF